MTTPTASVQVSVGGGAYTSGFVQAAPTQTLNFRQNPASASGASSYTWQLTDYPPALTLPAGWSSVNGVYTYVGAVPPTVTLPASGSQAWGPIGIRLSLNGNPLQYQAAGIPNPAFNPLLTDESTVVWVPSPGLGMIGLQLNASTQYDNFRAWIGQYMHDLRLLDSGSAGWRTAWDFDWTQGTSTPFNTDGAQSFGGYSFTKVNSANEATHASAGGGTGLALAPASGAQHFFTSAASTARSAPGMFLPFSSMSITNLSWRTPLRIWTEVSAMNTGSTLPMSDGLIVAVVHSSQISSASGNNLLVYASGHGYDGSTAFRLEQDIWFNSSQESNSANSQPSGVHTPLTAVMELPLGLAGAMAMQLVATSTSAPPWVAYNTLNPISAASYQLQGTNVFGSVGFNNGGNALAGNTPGQWGLMLCMVNQAGVTDTCTIGRSRVDYFGGM